MTPHAIDAAEELGEVTRELRLDPQTTLWFNPDAAQNHVWC
jgi:hypothetical protein